MDGAEKFLTVKEKRKRRVAAGTQDGAVFEPNHQADACHKAFVELPEKARNTPAPPDGAQVRCLEAEMDRFILQEAGANGTEPAGGGLLAYRRIVGHGHDFGANQHGHHKAEAKKLAEDTKDAVRPAGTEERDVLRAKELPQPMRMAVFLLNEKGHCFAEPYVAGRFAELAGVLQEMAAIGGFAELELSEGRGEEGGLRGGPGVLYRRVQLVRKVGAEVIAPGETGGDETIHGITLLYKVLFVKAFLS